jgi:hypothetical protein
VDTESGALDDESSPLVACSGPLVPAAIDLWVLAESVTDNSFVRADSSVTTRCNRPERPGKVPSIVKQPYWSSTTKRMAVDLLPHPIDESRSFFLAVPLAVERFSVVAAGVQ